MVIKDTVPFQFQFHSQTSKNARRQVSSNPNESHRLKIKEWSVTLQLVHEWQGRLWTFQNHSLVALCSIIIAYLQTLIAVVFSFGIFPARRSKRLDYLCLHATGFPGSSTSESQPRCNWSVVVLKTPKFEEVIRKSRHWGWLRVENILLWCQEANPLNLF